MSDLGNASRLARSGAWTWDPMVMRAGSNGAKDGGEVPRRRLLGSRKIVAEAVGGNGASSSGTPNGGELSSVPSDSSLSSLEPATVSALSQESSDLFCPICNEKMLTLPQLNRHLDDEHKADEPVGRLDADIKTWFKKKVISRATDVVNENRKNFVKLDLFDNDRNFTFSTANDSTPNANENAVKTPEIPKDHWRKSTGSDVCHLETCYKPLNIKNGVVNCRKCGHLFCNEHTFYKIKINPQLQYDAGESGVLVRCCRDCFMKKPGYNDMGYVRDLGSAFRAKRDAKTTETALEVNRLERRLMRFYEYFAVVESGRRPGVALKKFETTVVNWESDKDQNSCFICERSFSFAMMFRKHHCRLCGRVVCGDPDTQCSIEVPIMVLLQYLCIDGSRQLRDYKPLKDDKQLRCCIVCKRTLFDKRLFNKDLQSPKPEILKIYDTIVIYRSKIESLLPLFKGSMIELQQLDNSKASSHPDTMDKLANNHETIQSISQQRIKLKNLFKKLDQVTKRLHEKVVKDEAEGSLNFDELRLEKSIYSVSVSFLQENMSRLQEISTIEVQPQQQQQQEAAHVVAKPKVTKRQVRIYREKLMVLKEQKFLVQEMINSSKKKRKFDDLKSLESNLKDIEKEIDAIDSSLGVEFGFE